MQVAAIKGSKRSEAVREYYFSQKLREIEQMRESGIDVINLGIGSPDLAPSNSAINMLEKYAHNANSHGYQSYAGIKELREAFAQWYHNYFDTELDASSEVLPLMGSKEGIMHISMAFVNPGEQVLVPNPGYPTYAAITQLIGGEVINYNLTPENDWYPNIEELEKRDLSKVKLMWINYPNMPTGQKANKEVFKKLVAFAKRHSILLCNDNPYSFILNSQHLSLLSVEGAKEVALELNSISKSHNMPGWRIGMVAGHKEYIKAIIKVKSNMDSGMFKPMQMAAAKALSCGDEWYEQINREYRKRRVIAETIMEQLGCSFDVNQKGMFLWGKISVNFKNAKELSNEILYKTHVFITPGSIFGSQGERYIRLSLCASEEILREALSRIVRLNSGVLRDPIREFAV
ncbi:MAG: aminotransferase class I/II-fold pyridoxal phosphate-dependent enzyme [Bacteroidales bacterium]